MNNKDVLLNKIKDEVIKINSVEEFNDFCMELKDSSYQYYDDDMKNNIIPNIIEKLAKTIDIKNELDKWEEIIALLYKHFMDDFMENALNKLYNYYPNYPFECLFELVLYHYYDNGDCIPLWYNSINKIYTQFYIDKIDKELFDKYILFAYDDSRYFMALLYKNDFDIPKNSIYLDIEKLLNNRFSWYDLMGNGLSHQMLAQYGLSIKHIKNININKFDNYSYTNHGKHYSLIGIQRSGDIGFSDKDGIVYSLKTTFLKSAIFETEKYKERSKKKNSILELLIGNFHDFLIYKWGIVKYFKYLFKYGNYEQYSKLYNEFFIILEKEANEIDNTIAIKNLLEINKIFNQTIIEIYPDEIEETILLEGSKKQIVVNAYERNPKAREKCINRYGFNCFICGFNFQKTYGKIGKEFIHVHHLKPLSEIQEEYEVNPIEDLRPVCPNCHAMLHRKVPAYSIEEIRSILKGQKA